MLQSGTSGTVLLISKYTGWEARHGGVLGSTTRMKGELRASDFVWNGYTAAALCNSLLSFRKTNTPMVAKEKHSAGEKYGKFNAVWITWEDLMPSSFCATSFLLLCKVVPAGSPLTLGACSRQSSPRACWFRASLVSYLTTRFFRRSAFSSKNN